MNGKEWRKATGDTERSNTALLWGIAVLSWLGFMMMVLIV